MLTLDKLKRRGIILANRCFLCEEEEETIDHLLIHCPRAKMIWELFLAIVGSSWVFPRTVHQTLLAWQSVNVGRKNKRIWMAAPLCLFWTVWQARNRVAFEDVASFAHRMKITFLCTLWSWANLYSVDNTNSLMDFLVWLGYR